MKLAQSTILITGASSGFGREIALAALERGARVIATARNPATLDDLVAVGRDRLLTVRLDVTDETSCRAAVEAAGEKWGGVDILVNNAGYGLIGSVEEASDGEIARLFDVNFQGCVRTLRAVLPGMRERAAGVIVNMSSRAGVSAVGGCAYYAATKFALEGMSEALAQELKPLGIGVLIVEPGAFRTNYSAGSLAYTELAISDYAATSGMMRTLVAAKHGTQPGDPVRAAHAILDAVENPDRPLRLALGAEAAATIEQVYRDRLGELDRWKGVSQGADFATSGCETS